MRRLKHYDSELEALEDAHERHGWHYFLNFALQLDRLKEDAAKMVTEQRDRLNWLRKQMVTIQAYRFCDFLTGKEVHYPIIRLQVIAILDEANALGITKDSSIDELDRLESYYSRNPESYLESDKEKGGDYEDEDEEDQDDLDHEEEGSEEDDDEGEEGLEEGIKYEVLLGQDKAQDVPEIPKDTPDN